MLYVQRTTSLFLQVSQNTTIISASLDEEPLGAHRIKKQRNGVERGIPHSPATPSQRVRRRVGQLSTVGPANTGKPAGYAATRANCALRTAGSRVAAYHMADPAGPSGRRSTGRAGATPA